MKPIKLMMRAFGPYKSEETIDFTKLHENGIFVISGKTGAGKTTIFDGICFALYGFGSGQDRKNVKMLRSDFADDDVHTAVELIFELHGKKYRVFRQLAHVKKNRKAATGEKFEFFEVLESGEEVPAVERQRVTDINKKIEELIGLTYEQFCQIVMLPQGEFRKLLTSQSENKEEILRRIFKTDRFGKMVAILDEKRRNAEQKLNEVNTVKNTLISQISAAIPQRESLLFTYLDKDSNIYQIIEGLEEEADYYEKKILEDEQAYKESEKVYNEQYKRFIEAKSLNEKIENFEKKVRQLEQLEKEKPLFEQKKEEYEKAAIANNLVPIDDKRKELQNEKQLIESNLQEITNILIKAKEKLAEAEKLYKDEQNKQNERDKASQKVNELEKLRPVYEEIAKLNKEVQDLQIKKKTVEDLLQQIEQNFVNVQDHIKEKNRFIEKLEEAVEQLTDLVQKQNSLENVLKTIRQYNDLINKKEKLTKKLQDAANIWRQEKAVYEKEEEQFLNNQIARLAQKLVPGEPCPVCGSTHHNPVHIENIEFVDEKELNELKEKVSKLEQEKFELEGTIHAIEQQINELFHRLQEEKADPENQLELKKSYDELTVRIQELKTNRETLQKEKANLKEMQQQLSELEQQKKDEESKLKVTNDELIEKTTILEQKRSSIPSELQSLDELEKEIEKAVKERKRLFEAWEQIQKQFHDCEKEVITLEEKKKNTAVQLKQTKTKYEKANAQFEEALKNSIFETYEQFVHAIRPEEVQKQLQQEYMDFINLLNVLSLQVKEEREELKGKEKADLQELEEIVQQLKYQSEQAYQILNESKKYHQTCQQFINNLHEIAEKIVQLEKSSNRIINLYNLLRGQNNRKISFERYVLMDYLEQITEAANIRLKNLSNGQFYLQCSDRQESHGRASGLSLDVYDEYTGQTRDVKTLSGGEKFNASLSLALGMADIIQSYQGNVMIDTMFIDEGFGSLDEESLMKAIDTLIDLQKTGRLIGVISHVNELKDAMPAVLQVEKLKEGYSRTSILIKN